MRVVRLESAAPDDYPQLSSIAVSDGTWVVLNDVRKRVVDSAGFSKARDGFKGPVVVSSNRCNRFGDFPIRTLPVHSCEDLPLEIATLRE